jgi:hypothetical protein
MSIEIKYVKDAGIMKKERIVLKVKSDDDVGRYLLFDTTYVDTNKVSNKVRHSYWFPDKPVKKNDVVVVYTKAGDNIARLNSDGTETHFFYIGLSESIWNIDGDCAVLLEIDKWQFKKVFPVQSA